MSTDQSGVVGEKESKPKLTRKERQELAKAKAERKKTEETPQNSKSSSDRTQQVKQSTKNDPPVKPIVTRERTR